MGFYYGRDDEPPAEEKPPGCLDALLITRDVFGVVFWPVLALFVILADGIAMIWLFTSDRPWLALIPVALTAVGIWLFARWDQRRAPGDH